MSSKLLKSVIQRGSELDDIAASVGVKKRKGKWLKGVPKKNEDNSSGEQKSVLQNQVESMLFFDKAFSDRSFAANSSASRRETSLLKKKSKKVKEQIGNSRSSSSVYARKAHVPTFNKRKHAAQKKIKDLKELARMLKGDSKK
jgi:hypothetical protein|eukprot:scaffold1668_cov207-Chaetoceros_neogracile.AAC.2